MYSEASLTLGLNTEELVMQRIQSQVEKLDISVEKDQYIYHKLLTEYANSVHTTYVTQLSNESILTDSIQLFRKNIMPLFTTNMFLGMGKLLENIRTLLINGLRWSNILFHKTEYNRWKKFNFISYRKIMELSTEQLSTVPVYRPSLLLSSDLTLAIPIITDSIAVLPDNNKLNLIVDICKQLKKNATTGTISTDAYLNIKNQILALYNTTKVKATMDKLNSLYGSKPDTSTKDDLYPFISVYKDREGFVLVDSSVAMIEPHVKRITTVADTVEDIEDIFKKVIAALDTHTLKLDKPAILALAEVSDILGRVFSLFGMGMHYGMEVIHNHTLNLERIKKLALD